METKQTAVEWLVQEVNSDCLTSTFIDKDLINKALEMEKEQTEAARLEGYEFATQQAIKEIHKNYKPL